MVALGGSFGREAAPREIAAMWGGWVGDVRMLSKTPLGHLFYCIFRCLWAKNTDFWNSKQGRNSPKLHICSLSYRSCSLRLFGSQLNSERWEHFGGTCHQMVSDEDWTHSCTHHFFRVQILVACGAGAGLAAVRQGNAGDWSCFCCEGAQVVCKGCTWEEFALIVHANKTRHMVFN